jgi:hypothetical protein
MAAGFRPPVYRMNSTGFAVCGSAPVTTKISPPQIPWPPHCLHSDPPDNRKLEEPRNLVPWLFSM